MRKEAKGVGITIEEAYEAAKINLLAEIEGKRLDEDAIEFDIITMPKKKTFGIFGGSDAQVLAFIDLPDEKPKKVSEVKSEKPAKINRGNEKNFSAEKIRKKENNTKPCKEEKQADVCVNTVAEQPEEATVESTELAADSKAAKSVAYLQNVLEKLGCSNIVIRVAECENGAALYLSGEGLGVVIGHRGETLDALQYLCSLAANSVNGYFKVTINIGNYRERRQQALTGLAKRVSAQVLRTGRSRALEPMNPYERRIIHTAVQEIEGVTSASIGDGNGRKVVISPEKSANRPTRPKHPQPISDSESYASRTPKKDAELPLYGKIK